MWKEGRRREKERRDPFAQDCDRNNLHSGAIREGKGRTMDRCHGEEKGLEEEEEEEVIN